MSKKVHCNANNIMFWKNFLCLDNFFECIGERNNVYNVLKSLKINV
jgi:hypothetical protein